MMLTPISASVFPLGDPKTECAPGQTVMTLEEYLEKGGEAWFLTGKKKYAVQAMMVSKETSFHNELEVTDYTVTDDGVTVVMKGVIGEMYASKLPRVIASYTKPDGGELRGEDFAVKDAFIDIVTRPVPDSNYAMFVPLGISVTVVTSGGDVLHTNLPNTAHGDGDFLVCRRDENGMPDTSDVWVFNGALFPKCCDMSRRADTAGGTSEGENP